LLVGGRSAQDRPRAARWACVGCVAALGARRRRTPAAGDFGRDLLADHSKTDHSGAAPGRP